MFFYVTRSEGDGDSEAGEKSIAVLPLENMSPDPNNAFFAGGVQEDILTHLSSISSLKVIARASMVRYLGSDMSMKEIGEELGVHYLLDGSVRKDDNDVKVNVQLIDAAEGTHIWVNDYQRTLDDVFAISTQIASEVVRELVGAISPEEQRLLEKAPTENQVAYENYTKARELEIQFGNRGRSQQIPFLERAVAEDPLFVEAWTALARSGNREKSDSALLTARALDPNHPSVLHEHIFKLVFQEKKLELAHRVGSQALEKWPQDPKLNGIYGVILDAMGREDEGLAYHKKYIELDPFSFRSNNYIAHSYYHHHGDIDNALIHWERMREGWGDIQRYWYFLMQFYRTRNLESIAEMENHFDDPFWINMAQWLQISFGMVKDMPGQEESPGEITLDSVNAYLPFLHFLEGKPQLAKEKAINILNTLGVERNEVTWDSLQEIPKGHNFGNSSSRLLSSYYRSRVILLLALLGWSESTNSIIKDVEQIGYGNISIGVVRVFEHRYLHLQLLSWMDTEAAVDLLFDPEAKHNLLKRKWELATDYLLNQRLLKHPRVMEMIVEDGDWIDYLAERIPEYAKYRNP